jgi:hypothetical protein
MDFTSSRQRLENLSDDGRALDTIAGALFRIFRRLEELDAAMARLGRRLTALEPRQPAKGKAAVRKRSPRPPGGYRPRKGDDDSGLDPERGLVG